MAKAPPAPIRLSNYRPPDFVIDDAVLTFELGENETRVRSLLQLRRNPIGYGTGAPLRLDGEGLRLLSLALDGKRLGPKDIESEEEGGIAIARVPDKFLLEIDNAIAPSLNTALSGLYLSGGTFCTQCEPEGFRRITYFIDRPDVMARYETRIIAERARYPILLANGNPVAKGRLKGGRHWAKWVDPHPKPSYLFALVAGDLAAVRGRFRTRSGRSVRLAIWVPRGDEDKCAHAMASLKRAMAWDEQAFGLEYDLDVFNIVAIADFNMGAMENKGLNIFNEKYILAKPETATDGDFEAIEGVVAHEYFHNWTGNRVTLRDWFQLSLKEGLTVFRDQEFSADQGSRAVRRIAAVRQLRAAQFPEDAGPLAHPVRPQSYLRIDNFYTATVYQKGAEVIRMIATVLGKERFRRGIDLYIARHDNAAVTVEDFLAAMEDANGVDLARFKLWYDQAGTPEIRVEERFEPKTGRYRLIFSQKTLPTPGARKKRPLPIPIALGLLGAQGRELPLRLEGEEEPVAGTRVFLLRAQKEGFSFVGLEARPLPSLLRGFSAPVKLSGAPLERLKFLARYDPDPFCRWEALQQLAARLLLDRIPLFGRGGEEAEMSALEGDLIAAWRETLRHSGPDPAFAAEALTLPSESFLGDQQKVVDIEATHAEREKLRACLGRALESEFAALYESLARPGPARIDGLSIGRRALRNRALSYLAAARPERGARLAKAQFEARANMTDVLAALAVLADLGGPEREKALQRFYEEWAGEGLVIDKWFSLQGRSSLPTALAEVRALARHPAFERKNPNRVRSLLGAFCEGNPLRFHDPSGEGYAFLAGEVLALDSANPLLAARLVQPLGSWPRQEPGRRSLMRRELERILSAPALSRNTYEMVSKCLAAPSPAAA